MAQFCWSIATWFHKHNMISEEDINPLRFAFELILTQLLTFLSIFVVGVYCHVFYETMIYMIGFIILRRQIQGYHAKTFLLCYLWTLLNYLIVIFLCQYMNHLSLLNIIVLVFLCVIYKQGHRQEIKKLTLITIMYTCVLMTMFLNNMHQSFQIVTLTYFSVLVMRLIGGYDNEDSDSR